MRRPLALALALLAAALAAPLAFGGDLDGLDPGWFDPAEPAQRISLHETEWPWIWEVRGADGPTVHVVAEGPDRDDRAAGLKVAEMWASAYAALPPLVTRSIPGRIHLVADGYTLDDEFWAGRLSSVLGTADPGRPIDVWAVWTSTDTLAYIHGLGLLEEFLLHEFAHLIDFRFGYVEGRRPGPVRQCHNESRAEEAPRAAQWEEWQEDGVFVTDYAGTNVAENFAETFVAALALWRDPDDADLFRRVHDRMKPGWQVWKRCFRLAAASAGGRIWLGPPHGPGAAAPSRIGSAVAVDHVMDLMAQ